MTRGDSRFAWALSFLDLFTCALGGVFMLTILSVRERDEARANDPSGYFFVSARYDDTSALSPDERTKIVVSLPAEFRGSETVEPGGTQNGDHPGRFVLVGEQGRLVVVAARLPYGAAPQPGAPCTVRLPRKPGRVCYATENQPVTCPEELGETVPVMGRDYQVTVSWDKGR